MSGYDHWRCTHPAAMVRRVAALVLLAVLWALEGLVPIGDAHGQQQPAAKVYRIGYLSQGEPPAAPSRRFSRACENEDTSKVETSCGSSGSPMEAWTGFRNWPRSWCD